jgi:ubiquinone/menaquinone biosynthesis C-methylase UbiE
VEQTQDYDDKLVALLEALWGEGFLSPGGTGEVALVLSGIDLTGLRVLDIGCGTGGCARYIAQQFAPAEVVGVDVEPGVVERATQLAAEAGLADVTRFVSIEPGPLPFADGSFDVVFSKDSIVHIADKHALAAEVHRVLRPGGVFAASDWMAGSDAPMSEALHRYVELEGLGFGLASPDVYFAALRAAGFRDVAYRDRTAWLCERTHRELDQLRGELHERLLGEVGAEFLSHEIDVWVALCAVLDTAEMGAGHWRATRP